MVKIWIFMVQQNVFWLESYKIDNQISQVFKFHSAWAETSWTPAPVLCLRETHRFLAHNHSLCLWLSWAPGVTWHSQHLPKRKPSQPVFNSEPGIRWDFCSSVKSSWFRAVFFSCSAMGNLNWISTSQERHPVTSQQVLNVFLQAKHMSFEDFVISVPLLHKFHA